MLLVNLIIKVNIKLLYTKVQYFCIYSKKYKNYPNQRLNAFQAKSNIVSFIYGN